MNNRLLKSGLRTFALSAVVALGIAGCASTAETETAEETTGSTETATESAEYRIAIMPKAINIGYFSAWDEGAQAACVELGASCDYIGPNEATGPAQVQFINQAIQEGYDAIVISAADQNAIVPALEEAIAALRENHLSQETLGKHIFEKYIEGKTKEWHSYRTAVTDWEVKNYIKKY